MQRILELSAKTLRTGEARSKYDDQGGAWVDAIGLNPFISDDDYRFLIATTKAPTRIDSDGSVITDIPIAYCTDPSSSTGGTFYLLGSSGRFYRVVISSDAVTAIRPQTTLGSLTNPTGGMIGITDSGGNSYVFVAARQTLYRWDLNTADSETHWNSSNALFSSNHHPFHRLGSQVLFGNARYLGAIPLDQLHNQSTTLSNIDFQAVDVGHHDYEVTAIGDDGRYFIAALSQRLDDSEDIARTSRIIWYPGIGSNWDWEVVLEGERAIRAIVRNALGVFAIGEQTIYQIGFGQQPRLVRTFAADDRPGGAFNAIGEDAGPRVNDAAPFGDSLIFGRRGAVFGKRFPSEPITFTHPLQGHTDDISLIAPDLVKSRVYVGTEDSKLWYYDMSSAGNTTNDYTTRFFDLKGLWTLMRLEVELPASIGASDSMTITVTDQAGNASEHTLSQSTVDTADRHFVTLALDPQLTTAKVKITVEQTAGTPRLGAIYLSGEPADH